MANAYGFNFIKIGGIWIFRGQKPPLGGVTFDLRCPFSNSDELFQSKVMCENLVRIGWNRRYVNFEAGKKPPIRGGLHVTCDADLRTWPSYSSQKSYVKIWFWLVEPFKSYRVHKQTNKQTNIPTYQHTNIQTSKKKIRDATENNIRQKNSFPGG